MWSKEEDAWFLVRFCQRGRIVGVRLAAVRAYRRREKLKYFSPPLAFDLIVIQIVNCYLMGSNYGLVIVTQNH